MRIVLVEWYDACSCNIWEERGCAEHITPCITIGILTRENKRELEVVQNLNANSKSNSLAIPRGAIKRIRNLKIKEE